MLYSITDKEKRNVYTQNMVISVMLQSEFERIINETAGKTATNECDNRNFISL